MLPEIISFNKSMQYRIQEYEQLFDGVETACSEITEIWGSTLKDLAIINVGWQALWVLSEENCKKYELLFPTAIIVEVNEFNWPELTAIIQVLAVQEDILLPSIMEVPVIELHPLKIQDYDETDLEVIEDWLDKCRYFFKHLWYAWDAKTDVSLMDWCESHLKNRIKMQYDIKSGFFDKFITNYLKSLLAEAHNITSMLEKSFSFHDDKVTAVKKYIHRQTIKAELDLFEEPELRDGMILLKKKEKHLINFCEKSDVEEVKFVWMNGSCNSLRHYLNLTESLIDENAVMKVTSSLQDALDSSSTNNKIILPPGVHVMTSLRGIGNGGSFIGLDKCESLITTDSSAIPRAILFECFGFIELENLTISKSNGIAFQVFNGVLKLKNCRIISPESNSTSRGVVVVPGCKLFLEECEVQGFGTGIALQGDAQVSIVDTKITQCFEGIKVIGNVSLSLLNVTISFCSTFGIRVESSEVESDIPLRGDLNLLEDHNLNCKINAISVTLSNNGRGNVILKEIEPAFNLEETLKSDISNEVICLTDNEEESDKSSLEDIQICLNNAL